MTLSTWLTFFVASWAISFSPGAGAISAMSSGLKYGFARGYWNTAGLILGIVFCLNIESIREFISWMTSTTLFDPNVYYLTRLPADMEPRETAAIVGMALALSVLATLYPSWRASTLDPVEALRYE